MMTILNGYTNAAPHHRQNRRRERPGSRTRRTISRKSVIQSTIEEGIFEARDSSLPLPSDRAKPSPLLRQNFDQSWQRWKARQAEDASQAEKEKLKLEQERVLLFGGEVDDDELIRLGILYSDEAEHQDVSHANGNTVLCEVPLREAPMFVMRPSRRSRRQRSTWRSLPLYLSFSELSNDVNIARLLSPNHHKPAIQHRSPIPSTTASVIDIDSDIPQSLPLSTPALSSSPSSPIELHESRNSLNDFNTPQVEDWTFVTHTQTYDPTFSEPETWILCDDS